MAQVIIVDDQNGLRWDWTAPDYPYLVGVTMNLERGFRMSAGSFSIDAPYDAISDLMKKNASPFKVNNSISVRIGYGLGGWTPWFGGFLNDGGDGLSVGADGISGELRFMGLGTRPVVYTISKDILKQAAMNPLLLIETVSRELGVRLEITDTARQKISEYTMVSEEVGISEDNESGEIMSGLANKDHWDIVMEICHENGCTGWLSQSSGSKGSAQSLVIKTIEEAEQSPIINTYMIRGVIDEDNHQYPCYSFSPVGGVAGWFSSQKDPASAGVNVNGIDTGSGEVVEGIIVPEDQETPTRGDLPDGEPSSHKSEDGLVNDIQMPGNQKGTNISAPVLPGGYAFLAKMAIGHQSAANGAQIGNISTIGNPEESISNACRLLGAGEIFDGNYEIQKMTHSYTPGSWEMNLEVRSIGKEGVTGNKTRTRAGERR